MMFFEKSMKNWKIEQTARGKSLAEVKIQTIKDQNAKHGSRKTIILHYTVSLGATLLKDGIGKE